MVESDSFSPVEFVNGDYERIRIRPMYYELGFSESKRMYGRKVVLDKLLDALTQLPNEYGFLIWDVYRPRVVQARLFAWMREEIKKRQPGLSEQENFDAARQYMSPPSVVGEVYCAPHLSGGAIDLTLFYVASGEEVNMGTIFDDCTERAHRDYFENCMNLSADEVVIRNNRLLLQTVMEGVGFTAYRFEWWHFDYGNIFWSQATMQKEMFSALFADGD